MVNTKAKVIIVTGLTGAGKTTYCKRLQKNKEGHHFSIDEWMTSLFWQDMPKDPPIEWFIGNQEWYLERIKRCEGFIKTEVLKLSKLGINSILDLGFTTVLHRETYIKLARTLGARPEIHHLDVGSETRWQRIESRNQERGETYSMQVSLEMFHYMEDAFEDFSEKELSLLKTVSQ